MIIFRRQPTVNLKKKYFIVGIPLKRRSEEIVRLNDVYQNMVGVKHTLEKCVKYLVQTEPYRMLREWSYEISASPLGEDVEPDDFTDVRIYKFIALLSI